MALRKLHIPDSKFKNQMLQNIKKFIKEDVNCTYSWTPLKMWRRQSVSVSNSERTYFCSELVAKAYKESKLLREDGCPSSAYIPCHFAESHDLHLLNNCCLLKEQKITWT